MLFRSYDRPTHQVIPEIQGVSKKKQECPKNPSSARLCWESFKYLLKIWLMTDRPSLLSPRRRNTSFLAWSKIMSLDPASLLVEEQEVNIFSKGVWSAVWKGQRRHKDFDEYGVCRRRYCNRICGALIGNWSLLPPAKQRQLHVDPDSHLPCRPRFLFCLFKSL